MKRWLLQVGVLVVMLAPVCVAGLEPLDAGVKVTLAPATVWLVPGDGVVKLNFDLLLENRTADRLELESMAMTARDAAGRFLTARELNSLGMSPALATLPNRTVEPGKTLLIFNPFHELPGRMVPASLQYELVLRARSAEPATASAAPPIRVEVAIHPRPASLRTPLRLPVTGKVYVWEGSDFLTHHRRFDLTHPFVLETGVKNNIGRYGMDFMMVDEAGKRFRTDGKTPEDYLIYGQPVRAPADGIIMDCIDGRPDSPIGQMTVDYEAFVKTHDLRLFGGNWITIRHADGEYSYLAHLKSGSLKVKPGDRVKSGQVIAQAGNSGDSLEPHLHYHVLSRPELDCELLPAIFRHFRRWYGSKAVDVSAGSVDTGDVVESQ